MCGTNGLKSNLIMGNYQNVHENTHCAKRHGTIQFRNSSKCVRRLLASVIILRMTVSFTTEENIGLLSNSLLRLRELKREERSSNFTSTWAAQREDILILSPSEKSTWACWRNLEPREILRLPRSTDSITNFKWIPSKQIYSHMQKQIVARAIKFLWGPVIKTTNYNTQAKTSHRKSRTFILISRRTFLKRASRRWKKNLLISGESAFAGKKNFSSFPYAPAINSFDVEISENNFLLRLVSRVLRERWEERRKNVSVELVMPRVGHLQVSLPSNFDQIGMDSKTQR